MDCELCEHEGGPVLWRDEFCRVILNRHVGERLASPLG